MRPSRVTTDLIEIGSSAALAVSALGEKQPRPQRELSNAEDNGRLGVGSSGSVRCLGYEGPANPRLRLGLGRWRHGPAPIAGRRFSLPCCAFSFHVHDSLCSRIAWIRALAPSEKLVEPGPLGRPSSGRIPRLMKPSGRLVVETASIALLASQPALSLLHRFCRTQPKGSLLIYRLLSSSPHFPRSHPLCTPGCARLPQVLRAVFTTSQNMQSL